VAPNFGHQVLLPLATSLATASLYRNNIASKRCRAGGRWQVHRHLSRALHTLRRQELLPLASWAARRALSLMATSAGARIATCCSPSSCAPSCATIGGDPGHKRYAGGPPTHGASRLVPPQPVTPRGDRAASLRIFIRERSARARADKLAAQARAGSCPPGPLRRWQARRKLRYRPAARARFQLFQDEQRQG
jgi:hypothetical protein